MTRRARDTFTGQLRPNDPRRFLVEAMLGAMGADGKIREEELAAMQRHLEEHEMFAGLNEQHHTVLLEWTARTPTAAEYDGGPPRQLMRFEQPFANHNAGHIAFNPLARPGDPDFGMLYMGCQDCSIQVRLFPLPSLPPWTPSLR